jgi:hypothetical protein
MPTHLLARASQTVRSTMGRKIWYVPNSIPFKLSHECRSNQACPFQYSYPSRDIFDYWNHVLRILVTDLFQQPRWKELLNTNADKIQSKQPTHLVRLILENGPGELCLEEIANYQEGDQYPGSLGSALEKMRRIDGMALCGQFTSGTYGYEVFTCVRVGRSSTQAQSTMQLQLAHQDKTSLFHI